MKPTLLVSMILLLALTSCEQKTKIENKAVSPSPAPDTAKTDPVAELKAHAHKANSALPPLYWSDIKYDVKKTDSLVSPYSGSITGRLTHGKLQFEYDVRLAYSDGTWRIAELRAIPRVTTGETLFSYGWHTFTRDDDVYKAYTVFQKSFEFAL